MPNTDVIKKLVHKCYWDRDINCANTTLYCLSKLFGMPVSTELYKAAAGLHGAGGYRAQCGLVEGALLFIGLYGDYQGKSEAEIIRLCYCFAERFEKKFESLQCYHLRPGGFTETDPLHACEKITVEAVSFIYKYVSETIF